MPYRSNQKEIYDILEAEKAIFRNLAFILIAAFDFHPRHPQAERFYCPETATTISEVFIAFFLSSPSVVKTLIGVPFVDVRTSHNFVANNDFVI